MSALNKFQISERNKMSFNKRFWHFKVNQFCYSPPLWQLAPEDKNLATSLDLLF
jgi:hypothetical protein